MADNAFSLVLTTDYRRTTCCVCGIEMVMPRQFYDKRLADHVLFFCLNGHEQRFAGKTEAEKLREEVAREVQRREMAEREALQERKLREKVDRKMKRLMKSGCCPVEGCRRNFFGDKLTQHIQAKHPEYKI